MDDHSNVTENYFLVPNDQLPIGLRFTSSNTVLVVVYTLLFLIALLVNSLFVVILIRRRRRTRTHHLMICLCLSNFYVVLLEMPQQIAWNVTVYWAGNDALCRGLAYFGMVGLYGSAFFTVAIAFDRWQLISRSSVSNQSAGIQAATKNRTRWMIASAWTLAHICSIPQAMIFHVEEHPKYKNFYQCVTFNSIPRLGEILYNVYVTCLIYFVPLLVLTFCSVAIWLYIRRHANSYTLSSTSCAKKSLTQFGADTSHQFPVSLSFANRLHDRNLRFRCSTKRLLCRAEKQAFRLTVVFLTIFIACHTPYQIISLWQVVNPDLGHTLNPIIHGLLFACGVVPCIVDPIVYAQFLIPITNELKAIMARKMKPGGRRSQSGNSIGVSEDDSLRTGHPEIIQNPQPFVQLFVDIR